MKYTSHLDIGCNSNPRNPYNADKLYGVDIIDLDTKDFNYQKCNLIFDSLPFPDSSFDSVSAYDFLEHVPRTTTINNTGVFPFIHVMNEIYRVLKPGGIFHSITPGYPRSEAFVDPTHVNFITKKTHTYFTSPKYKARMYGFKGKFKVVEGASSLDPQLPKALDGAMHLYTLSLAPFTLSTEEIEIDIVDNRRYTMRDIGRLEKRIENIEYYTQLSLLETQTQNYT